MNRQFVLNILAVIASVLVLLFVGSWLLRLSPYYLIVQATRLLIYLIGLVSQITLPFLIGLAIRRHAVEWLDSRFGGPNDHLPGFVLTLLGIATCVLVGMFFTWVTPYVALIPTFSVWPTWEIFRWTAHQGELVVINYWIFAWASVTSGIAYYFTNEDIKSKR